jgi:large subunit ribosomal protein L20
MTRVSRGVTARYKHKKVLKQAKGYFGARSRTFRSAKQSVIKAKQYAYIGRKLKKRDFRSLWIVRINAAVRKIDPSISYSKFINLLNNHNIDINRKMLSELAVMNNDAFKNILSHVSQQ